uniref:Putative secreted protein n=1 Tax=Anopheles triannulatus TaxID=58253 RepID=A0A2M4B6U4_9DIPT
MKARYAHISARTPLTLCLYLCAHSLWPCRVYYFNTTETFIPVMCAALALRDRARTRPRPRRILECLETVRIKKKHTKKPLAVHKYFI